MVPKAVAESVLRPGAGTAGIRQRLAIAGRKTMPTETATARRGGVKASRTAGVMESQDWDSEGVEKASSLVAA